MTRLFTTFAVLAVGYLTGYATHTPRCHDTDCCGPGRQP